MKRSLLVYSFISLLLFSCSKSNDPSQASSNTWTFAGTTYTAGTVTYVDGGSVSNLSAAATGATSTSADGLVFAFTPPPTGNCQMLISKSNDPNTVLVAVSKLSGTTTTYYLND